MRKRISNAIRGSSTTGPRIARPWRVWDLDSELRYLPVVAHLPRSDLPICEIGSGPQGLANWTDRTIIGVDPGSDERHGLSPPPPNLHRVVGDGASIPLADRSVAASVAVDTFEHIPTEARRDVVKEMDRVTVDGGRIILMGPTGHAAAAADRRVLERWRERDDGTNIVTWLSEHEQIGLPVLPELVSLLQTDRAVKVDATGVFNLELWWTMHRALLGDFPQPRGEHLYHHLLWGPFGFVARRYRRGPFYRHLVVAELAAASNSRPS